MRCALVAIALALLGCTALKPGTDVRDAGAQRDSGGDANMDAGVGADAGRDASLDASVDASSDAGPPDAGPSVLDGVRLALGGTHSCITNGRGGVVCWGRNVTGELGRVPSDAPRPPALVPDLSGVDQVCAGLSYTCARAASEVYCWGLDDRGQLGNGAAPGSHTPQRVENLPAVTHIACGPDTACAVTLDLDLYCWGDNATHQIAPDARTHFDAATRVAGTEGRTTTRLAIGPSHTCAVLSTGPGTYCWGDNSSEQFGRGPSTSTPLMVDESVDVLAAGTGHTCWLITGRPVFCMGIVDDRTVPPTSTTIADLSAGDEFTCGLGADGVTCWGDNTSNQLGGSPSPHHIGELGADVVQVATGSEHACALTPTELYCWGVNRSGQVTLPASTHEPVTALGLRELLEL